MYLDDSSRETIYSTAITVSSGLNPVIAGPGAQAGPGFSTLSNISGLAQTLLFR